MFSYVPYERTQIKYSWNLRFIRSSLANYYTGPRISFLCSCPWRGVYEVMVSIKAFLWCPLELPWSGATPQTTSLKLRPQHVWAAIILRVGTPIWEPRGYTISWANPVTARQREVSLTRSFFSGFFSDKDLIFILMICNGRNIFPSVTAQVLNLKRIGTLQTTWISAPSFISLRICFV